jgi:ABC-type polysaccharide transport system permease subunit
MAADAIVVQRYGRWRRRFALSWRTTLFCYVALLPVLALFAYVRVVPIGFSVLLSFYKWKLISPLKPFIGLENYRQLMADDNFILALKNTTIYSLSTVIISIVLALPLAVFLAGGRRWSAFYQTIYFLPVITPMVPMSIAWKWIYDYNYGILNFGLSLVGIAPVPWLTDPEIALWALVIMGVWKVIGYNLILFLVGIRNIPASYLEAASLDGATAWQRDAEADPALCPGDLDDQRLQRLHAGLCDDLRLAGGTGPGGPHAGLRHLPERLPVFPHGLRLGRGGGADDDRHRLHADPVPPGAQRAGAGGLSRWARSRIARFGLAWVSPSSTSS